MRHAGVFDNMAENMAADIADKLENNLESLVDKMFSYPDKQAREHLILKGSINFIAQILDRYSEIEGVSYETGLDVILSLIKEKALDRAPKD